MPAKHHPDQAPRNTDVISDSLVRGATRASSNLAHLFLSELRAFLGFAAKNSLGRASRPVVCTMRKSAKLLCVGDVLRSSHKLEVFNSVVRFAAVDVVHLNFVGDRTVEGLPHDAMNVAAFCATAAGEFDLGVAAVRPSNCKHMACLRVSDFARITHLVSGKLRHAPPNHFHAESIAQ